MKCEQYQKKLSFLLDNGIEIIDFPDVQQHLQQCELCFHIYNSFLHTQQYCKEAPLPFSISQNFVENVMRDIAPPKKSPPRLIVISLCVAIGLLIYILCNQYQLSPQVKTQEKPQKRLQIDPRENLTLRLQQMNNITMMLQQIGQYQGKGDWEKTIYILEDFKRRVDDVNILIMTSYYLATLAYKKQHDLEYSLNELMQFAEEIETTLDFNNLAYVQMGINLTKDIEKIIPENDPKKQMAKNTIDKLEQIFAKME